MRRGQILAIQGNIRLTSMCQWSVPITKLPSSWTGGLWPQSLSQKGIALGMVAWFTASAATDGV